MHPTTIAKIESTEPRKRRSVKIDEAAGMADLFEVSLDSLLGRTSGGLQSDLAYTLRLVSDTAEQSAHQVSAIANTLGYRLRRPAPVRIRGARRPHVRGWPGATYVRAVQQHLHRVSQFEDAERGWPTQGFR